MRSLGVALVAEACTDLFGLYVSILDMDVKWERRVCVCVCVCVCVWTSSSHLYHLLYRSMKTEELHYSKNMHKHAWQSSPSVEPNRNMDPLSYAPCHTDIWFIPSRADTIWHRRDTLTLCDALSHRRLWRITSMDVKKKCFSCRRETRGGDLLSEREGWRCGTLEWPSSPHIHLQVTQRRTLWGEKIRAPSSKLW